jgi:hypothetical protein
MPSLHASRRIATFIELHVVLGGTYVKRIGGPMKGAVHVRVLIGGPIDQSDGARRARIDDEIKWKAARN